MQKIVSHTRIMQAAIRASKEIIVLKQARQRLKFWCEELSRETQADMNNLKAAENDMLYRIEELKAIVAAHVCTVTEGIPYFPEITHFTQKELDAGYCVVEQAIDEEGEEVFFDNAGEFMESPAIFIRYIFNLFNGNVIPFNHTYPDLIMQQVKPV